MNNYKQFNFEQLVKELDKYKFRQLHIHHTWKPNHSNFRGNNYISMQQGMYNYHTRTNGWSDIGQHLSLFPDGVWLTGRPFNIAPASIKGWNTGALAVEMIGDFDRGRDKLEGKQKEEILKLTKYFIDKYGVQSIKFHREGPGVTKSCPGTSLNKTILIKEAKEIDKERVKVNILGRVVELDGYLKNGTNYIKVDTGKGHDFLPIRNIAESMGMKVGWDGVNRQVTLK